MGITITVSTDSTEYFAGDAVGGLVTLSVVSQFICMFNSYSLQFSNPTVVDNTVRLPSGTTTAKLPGSLHVLSNRSYVGLYVPVNQAVCCVQCVHTACHTNKAWCDVRGTTKAERNETRINAVRLGVFHVFDPAKLLAWGQCMVSCTA